MSDRRSQPTYNPDEGHEQWLAEGEEISEMTSERIQQFLSDVLEHFQAIEANAKYNYQDQTKMHVAHRRIFHLFEDAGKMGVQMVEDFRKELTRYDDD
jgi:hypothetical protein